MKQIPLTLLALSLCFTVGCNPQKAAIDTKTEATNNEIEHQKEALDASAKDAAKQAEINAVTAKANLEAEKVAVGAKLDAAKTTADADAIAEKASIEATRIAAQAQLDADRKKTDAEAVAEKERVDAEKK